MQLRVTGLQTAFWQTAPFFFLLTQNSQPERIRTNVSAWGNTHHPWQVVVLVLDKSLGLLIPPSLLSLLPPLPQLTAHRALITTPHTQQNPLTPPAVRSIITGSAFQFCCDSQHSQTHTVKTQITREVAFWTLVEVYGTFLTLPFKNQKTWRGIFKYKVFISFFFLVWLLWRGL